MMAYLDWDKAEGDRVEAIVTAEMEAIRFPKEKECVKLGRLQQRMVRHKRPYK